MKNSKNVSYQSDQVIALLIGQKILINESPWELTFTQEKQINTTMTK